jgi:hypothetical protein
MLSLFGEQKMVDADTLQTIEDIWLLPVRDANNNPTWVCRLCHVVGAHLPECGAGRTLAVLQLKVYKVYDEKEFGHGYTCGECEWGRDKYHPMNEYQDHVFNVHKVFPL